MLTEDTTNAFMCLETVHSSQYDALDAALDALKDMIEKELGGSVEKHVLSAESPETVISD